MKKVALVLGSIVVLTAGLGLAGFPVAASAGQLEASSYQGIPYVSGGIGFDERQEMRAMRSGYTLSLLFAARDGSYCADIEVKIASANGEQVFAAGADGPWFLVNLPAGRYSVTVTPAGGAHAQQKDVTIKSGGHSELNFFWE